MQPNISETEDWTTRVRWSSRYTRLAYLSLQAALSEPDGAAAPDRVARSARAFRLRRRPASFAQQAEDLARLARTYFLFGTVAHTPAGRAAQFGGACSDRAASTWAATTR